MRVFVILTILVTITCVCYTQGAAVQLAQDEKETSTMAAALLGVDAGGKHSNAANRGTRQFGAFGVSGRRPFYGSYGHRPYYGYGYGGYPSYGYGGYGGGYGGYGGGYGGYGGYGGNGYGYYG